MAPLNKWFSVSVYSPKKGYFAAVFDVITEQKEKEELIAEMGAVFLCTRAGIINTTFDTSTAYINSWRSRLESDNKFVIQAANAAQKATNLILGVKHEPAVAAPVAA